MMGISQSIALPDLKAVLVAAWRHVALSVESALRALGDGGVAPRVLPGARSDSREGLFRRGVA